MKVYIILINKYVRIMSVCGRHNVYLNSCSLYGIFLSPNDNVVKRHPNAQKDNKFSESVILYKNKQRLNTLIVIYVLYYNSVTRRVGFYSDNPIIQ